MTIREKTADGQGSYCSMMTEERWLVIVQVFRMRHVSARKGAASLPVTTLVKLEHCTCLISA